MSEVGDSDTNFFGCVSPRVSKSSSTNTRSNTSGPDASAITANNTPSDNGVASVKAPGGNGARSIPVSLPLSALTPGDSFITQSQLSDQLAAMQASLLQNITLVLGKPSVSEPGNSCEQSLQGIRQPNMDASPPMTPVLDSRLPISVISSPDVDQRDMETSPHPFNNGSEVDSAFDNCDLYDLINPSSSAEDPFGKMEGLENFALPGVASALTSPQQSLTPDTIQANLWKAARGGDTIRRIPISKIEKLYANDNGVFAAPRLPSSIQLDRRSMEVDELYRNQQVQWAMMGQALSRGLAQLDVFCKDLKALSSSNGPVQPAQIEALICTLSHDNVQPFAQAFAWAHLA